MIGNPVISSTAIGLADSPRDNEAVGIVIARTTPAVDAADRMRFISMDHSL